MTHMYNKQRCRKSLDLTYYSKQCCQSQARSTGRRRRKLSFESKRRSKMLGTTSARKTRSAQSRVHLWWEGRDWTQAVENHRDGEPRGSPISFTWEFRWNRMAENNLIKIKYWKCKNECRASMAKKRKFGRESRGSKAWPVLQEGCAEKWRGKGCGRGLDASDARGDLASP